MTWIIWFLYITKPTMREVANHGFVGHVHNNAFVTS